MKRWITRESIAARAILPITLLAANLALAACTNNSQQPDKGHVTAAPCPTNNGPDKIGREIPVLGADAQVLIDTMRTPADGVNRNTHIVWEGAKVAAQKNYLRGRILHSIVVNYGSEGSISTNFRLADVDKDNRYEIATVSGGGPAESSELTTDLSMRLESKLQESLPPACLSASPTPRPSHEFI